MTQDPRIIPDEQLAEWEAEASGFMSYDHPYRKKILALIAHGKALAEQVRQAEAEVVHFKNRLHVRYGELDDARNEVYRLQEQVDTLTRRLDTAIYSQQVNTINLKRASLARDDALVLRDAEKARADAAVRALADRDKAISDLANRYARAHFQPPLPGPMVATDLRALLTEDGAS